MEQRRFFIALGVPKGADASSVQVAYRRVVTRYRTPEQPAEQPARPSFQVLRTYSDRRHGALMEQEAEVVPDAAGEVDRFYGGFVPEVLETPPVSDSTRAQRAGKDLYVELRLSHSEARIGGLVPVHIPVFRRCPVCSEGAEEQRLVCKACSGTGRITEDHMVEVTVPPRVRDGQTAQVAMEDVGLGATTLMVYVSVGGE